MRRFVQFVVVVFLGSLLCDGSEASPTFSRYQIILDRKPFGEAPPAAPEPVVIPEKDKFARNFRMSAILEFEDVWKIGLIELKTKEDFYLAVGDTEKGVTLVDVDWDAEEATIKKGLEVVVLKLGTGEVVPAAGAPPNAAPAPSRRVPPSSRRPPASRPGVRRPTRRK